METPAHTTHTWRFGVFQVDAREGSLLRAGMPVHIREQSFRVLVLLLDHAGELVTRDQLRAALWPSDTFVDFEHGLNTAVMKLREALDDSAETPLYIETVPKRGYRFIAPLSPQADTPAEPANPDFRSATPRISAPVAPEQATTDAPDSPRSGRIYARIGAILGLLLIVVTIVILVNVRGWRDRLFVRPPQVDALAVLPFTNLSGDPKQEYFSDGMTEALITELGRLGGPRVISRQSVMQFKGSQKPLDQIARELKVDAILEGAVERSGDRVRITVHLAQGNPERQLWAEQYDRDIRDVLAVQADIARSVADAIRTELSRQELAPAAPRRVIPEAYQAYLQGRYLSARMALNENSKAEESLRRSIQLDPTFAPAYSAISISYYAEAINGVRPATELFPLARAAALKALELDDRLAEAHSALGVVKYSYEWDWAGAEQELKRAVLLNPSSVDAHIWYGTFLAVMGRLDQAILEYREAVRLDPLSPFSNLHLGWSLYFARRQDESIAQLKRVLELDPQFAWANMELAWNYAKKGVYREAFAECRQALNIAPENQIILANCGRIYGEAGQRQDAVALLARLMALSQKGYLNPCDVAVVYDGLGDTDQAIEWLQRAYNERCTSLLFLKIEYSDRLHSDPRFQALLRKVYPD